MKYLMIALPVIVGGIFLGSLAHGEIAGSAHDFSNSNFTGGQFCLPCHAPHSGQDVDGAPLWNHSLSTTVYEMYTSPQFTADEITQPGGVSKLCLSCHDGTIAIDAFGQAGGTSGRAGRYIDGGRDLGVDLSNDHPISFIYDSALVAEDGGLFEPTTTFSNIAGSTGTIASDMLFGGKVECASCHDVHNKFDNLRLLKIDNRGSALCLTCHDK